ncbi:KPN_02809 family neutral zinc metallopeptidase [Thalassoglobus polymorphus]|uniref:Neutral zinc metallopeptidase n=1 Tax=Thalassoglobus polymorphus TaxID=2527994 RepID=A0A517QJJ9_9PLAN|nr:neutral zinc metallopeptidase [Thalassoglobus polymorphus]QDT31816.1 Putative neutral zinc metallopeptidase [Thalassoglobus polymorphus]
MVSWKGRRQSSNVEDRRGMKSGGKALGGGMTIILLIAVFIFSGGDLGQVFRVAQQLPQQGGQQNAAPAENPSPAEEEMRDFVATILADTEDVWNEIFRGTDVSYREPTLVIFRDGVSSACGFNSSAVGPFYCPGDEKVYIDLGFFDQLERQLNAPGDFAQAYVIAHEVGHHVQNLLGITEMVQRERGRLSEAEYNLLQVRLELQADFFAGVWAHHAERMKNLLEPGDIEEGLNAAAMIGDDTLQKRARGYVVEESFTHGSAEQRARWFRKGLETGDINQGDTFKAKKL